LDLLIEVARYFKRIRAERNVAHLYSAVRCDRAVVYARKPVGKRERFAVYARYYRVLTRRNFRVDIGFGDFFDGDFYI
ncbi:hypothetical protein, partial [Klebsiella pneumoniae]|uniref:hypothetical protein n=1 Tax=Klebsiella pneumoniae TaxID=573 RepID=UPI00272F0EC2